MKLEFSQQISEIFKKIVFNLNMSSGSGVVPYGRTERWTDITKSIVNLCMGQKIHSSN